MTANQLILIFGGITVLGLVYNAVRTFTRRF